MLIDKEVALKEICEKCYYHTSQDFVCRKCNVYELLEKQPAVEAEPVRHGRWLKYHTDYGAKYYCSACCIKPIRIRNGELFQIEEFIICPFCGAKMDGGSNNG